MAPEILQMDTAFRGPNVLLEALCPLFPSFDHLFMLPWMKMQCIFIHDDQRIPTSGHERSQICSCPPLCFLHYHFPYICVLQLWHIPQPSSLFPAFVLEPSVSWRSPGSFQSRQILRNQNQKVSGLRFSQ